MPCPLTVTSTSCIFGATGFTGELTAEYLAEHAPAGCRWALAGRSTTKLEAVRSRLAESHPECADLPLLHADAGDPASMKAVAESARVVITTVGPYLLYGGPLVAACAEAGTDYVDLTGEPEFVDRIYLAHHERAVETGARIVHACGFDSIPHDLGAYFTVQQLPAGDADPAARHRPLQRDLLRRHLPLRAQRVLARPADEGGFRQRRRKEARPAGRKVRTIAGRPGRESALGVWRCRCRPSTRSSWPGRRPRSRRTGLTSGTPTTPA